MASVLPADFVITPEFLTNLLQRICDPVYVSGGGIMSVAAARDAGLRYERLPRLMVEELLFVTCPRGCTFRGTLDESIGHAPDCPRRLSKLHGGKEHECDTDCLLAPEFQKPEAHHIDANQSHSFACFL